MTNFVLEGLRQRKLEDIRWEIWFTIFSSCASEVDIELVEEDMKNWVSSA